MNSFWKNKKVFITGHDGFIGSHLVGKLESLGAKVYFSRIDLLKEKLKAEDYLGIEIVFHLAARAPASSDVVEAEKVIEENLGITKNVLEFVSRLGAKMILTSTSHVYPSESPDNRPWKESDMKLGEALSSYGLSKQAVERLCLEYSEKYNFPLVVVRFSNIYGIGDKSNKFIPTFIRKCLNKKLPLDVLGDKRTIRDFIYIDDAVGGLTKSASVLGYNEAVNIGSGAGMSIEQAAEIIKNNAGLGGEEIKCESSGAGKVVYNVLNIDNAKDTMGFKPEVSFLDGINKTINWWKEQKD